MRLRSAATGSPPPTTVDRARGIDLVWKEMAAIRAIHLDSDELPELMSPTLDPDRCPGPSHGTPGGPFGIFNPDGSRALPAARRLARPPSRSSATSRMLMVYRFDWS